MAVSCRGQRSNEEIRAECEFYIAKKKLPKHMQMHKMFPRVFISPNFACRGCVIVAADNVGHALIKAGCRPAQDAILQGDRKPFRVDINHS